MNDQIIMEYFSLLTFLAFVQFASLLLIVFFGWALSVKLKIYRRISTIIAMEGKARTQCEQNMELLFLGMLIYSVLFFSDAVLVSCFY